MSLLASYLVSAAGNKSDSPAADQNWWVVLDNANAQHHFNSIGTVLTDSAGNVLVGGGVDNTISPYYDTYFIAKFSDAGSLLADREFGYTTIGVFFYDMCIDGNGDLYLTGSYGTNPYVTSCVKVDSGLTTNDFRITAYNTPSINALYYQVTTDSNNDVYLAGRVEEFMSNDEAVGIAKCDGSNGSNTWKRTWAGNQDNFKCLGLCVHDNSGTDEIFVSPYDDTTNAEIGYILEYNTSGTLQNTYEYNGKASSTSNTYKRVNFGNIVSDGTSLYVAFAIDYDLGVAKIDPADGDILWQKNYNTNSIATHGYRTHCAVTPDGNYVYSFGRGSSALSNASKTCWLGKYATSDGTLQWQRNIRLPGTTYSQHVHASNDNVYILCINATSELILVAKLPVDGSGTGTYSGVMDIVYEVANSAETTMILSKDTSPYTEQASNIIFGNSGNMTNVEGGIEVDQTNTF